LQLLIANLENGFLNQFLSIFKQIYCLFPQKYYYINVIYQITYQNIKRLIKELLKWLKKIKKIKANQRFKLKEKQKQIQIKYKKASNTGKIIIKYYL